MKLFQTPRLCLSAALLTTMCASQFSQAQETSAAIRGSVVAGNGEAVSDAVVTVVHTLSNSLRRTEAAESGQFSLSGLRIGGPYRVTVESTQGKRVFDDIYLSVGTLPLVFTLDASNIEEVSVVGQTGGTSRLAMGPSSHFNGDDLQSAPSVNRDIKDLLRLDPRVYIDEGNVDAIQCAGANPRFNSLTVDGVRMNDNFGLNNNGYPTERMPFSYDAIEQVAIELAPFDVQYGGFSACNINAVTKSGSNEWYGSFFYDYSDDGFRSDSFGADGFDEQRFNGTLGGAIIEDKLFFFGAYEKLEGVATFGRGPAGSDAATEVAGVSQQQLNEITRIAEDAYGYNPGGLPSSLPEEDEKILAKLDWNISDNHRAAFTYNYNKGHSIAQADNYPDTLELSSHYYERGAELNAYVLQTFSDWNDIFSSEFKVGYSKLETWQQSLGGSEFGEVQIATEHDHDNDGNVSRATVFIGSDDSRHANTLSYNNLNIKLAGKLLLGEHNLLAGYEHERFDIFNLFVQESEGEYRFDSIEAFELGIPSQVIYENAALSNNPDDAAAKFAYNIDTFYLQDEYTFTALDLTAVLGVRYDRYSSGDKPRRNPQISAVYGLSNQHNMDGLDLLQPRLGLSWNVSDRLEVHGGLGLYSGGNPNVWISNNYANNGVTQLEVRDSSGTSLFDRAWTGSGRPIYDIPQSLYDQVANGDGGSGGVNLLAPDFEIPSVWKYAVGASYEFESGYLLSADYLYSDYQNAALIRDISLHQVGTAVDGRPIYANADGRREDLMLTNVNGDSGYSQVLSLGLSKSFDFGLRISLGYAYTEAEDVNPMTSSVAYSNYTKLATTDAENPGTATSNYVVPHRITLKLDYAHEFFAGYETRFTLFGSATEGGAASLTCIFMLH